MPRSSRTPSLARLLDQCPDPVYVVDARRRFVYANSSLLAWIGLGKEEVVGQSVDYHAHEGGATPFGIAKGLCPPPAAFAGQCASGHVSRLRNDGEVEYRNAQFLPIGHGEANDKGQRCVGVVAVLHPKVFTAAELQQRTSREPSSQELHAALAHLRRQRALRGAGAALIGDSASMARTRRQVALAAQVRSPVLVAGNDEWQRRRVAEAIPHANQYTTDEAVIPFDCQLLDENLLSWSLESLADRGREPLTLLLNDMHELTDAAQEFLAERIDRWPSEWRVIATYQALTADNELPQRLDVRLIHWLSTLVIDLAPLAARMEDLPIACQFMIEEHNAAGEKQIGGFAQAALDRMHLFDWPGGLEQLGDVVAAAHAAATGPEIAPADLPPFLTHAETAAAFPPEAAEPINLEELLAGIETSLIGRALTQADGNKTQAAALLGMTRPRLYRRMEQLGME